MSSRLVAPPPEIAPIPPKTRPFAAASMWIGASGGGGGDGGGGDGAGDGGEIARPDPPTQTFQDPVGTAQLGRGARDTQQQVPPHPGEKFQVKHRGS